MWHDSRLPPVPAIEEDYAPYMAVDEPDERCIPHGSWHNDGVHPSEQGMRWNSRHHPPHGQRRWDAGRHDAPRDVDTASFHPEEESLDGDESSRWHDDGGRSNEQGMRWSSPRHPPHGHLPPASDIDEDYAPDMAVDEPDEPYCGRPYIHESWYNDGVHPGDQELRWDSRHRPPHGQRRWDEAPRGVDTGSFRPEDKSLDGDESWRWHDDGGHPSEQGMRWSSPRHPPHGQRRWDEAAGDSSRGPPRDRPRRRSRSPLRRAPRSPSPPVSPSPPRRPPPPTRQADDAAVGSEDGELAAAPADTLPAAPAQDPAKPHVSEPGLVHTLEQLTPGGARLRHALRLRLDRVQVRHRWMKGAMRWRCDILLDERHGFKALASTKTAAYNAAVDKCAGYVWAQGQPQQPRPALPGLATCLASVVHGLVGVSISEARFKQAPRTRGGDSQRDWVCLLEVVRRRAPRNDHPTSGTRRTFRAAAQTKKEALDLAQFLCLQFLDPSLSCVEDGTVGPGPVAQLDAKTNGGAGGGGSGGSTSSAFALATWAWLAKHDYTVRCGTGQKREEVATIANAVYRSDIVAVDFRLPVPGSYNGCMVLVRVVDNCKQAFVVQTPRVDLFWRKIVKYAYLRGAKHKIRMLGDLGNPDCEPPLWSAHATMHFCHIVQKRVTLLNVALATGAEEEAMRRQMVTYAPAKFTLRPSTWTGKLRGAHVCAAVMRPIMWLEHLVQFDSSSKGSAHPKHRKRRWTSVLSSSGHLTNSDIDRLWRSSRRKHDDTGRKLQGPGKSPVVGASSGRPDVHVASAAAPRALCDAKAVVASTTHTGPAAATTPPAAAVQKGAPDPAPAVAPPEAVEPELPLEPEPEPPLEPEPFFDAVRGLQQHKDAAVRAAKALATLLLDEGAGRDAPMSPQQAALKTNLLCLQQLVFRINQAITEQTGPSPPALNDAERKHLRAELRCLRRTAVLTEVWDRRQVLPPGSWHARGVEAV